MRDAFLGQFGSLKSEKIGLTLPKNGLSIVFILIVDEQSPSFYKGQGLSLFLFLDLRMWC